MKFSMVPSLLLPLLAAAAPAAPENPPFGVMSARSASPIHLLPMTASGQKFYLGGKTQSYCPLPESKDCPPGTETVFSPGGYGLVSPLFSFPRISCLHLLPVTNGSSPERQCPRRPAGLC